GSRDTMLGSAQQEALADFVLGLEGEACVPRVMRLAADLDDDGLETAGARFLQDLSGEDGAGQAFEEPLLARRDELTGMLHGEARGYAAPRRAAVDLALGENADVGARPLCRAIHAVGQDGAVEKGELWVLGMLEAKLGLCGMGDARRRIDELARART